MAGFGSGLFWGAFFGGLAGLMNAPQKGSETRKDLKIWLDRTKHDVNDVRFKVDNLRVAVQRLTQEGIPAVTESVKEIQTSLRHFQEESEPRVRRIQEDVNTLTSDLETISQEQNQDNNKDENQEN